MRRAVAVLLLGACALLGAGCGEQPGPPSIAVGAGPEPESALLAHLYASALRYYGTPAHVEQVTDPVAGLDAADVSVVAGLTGRLLRRFEPDATVRKDDDVYERMIAALPEGIAAGDYAESAYDKPAPAVSDATAQRWGGREVTQLVRHCAELTVGAVEGSAHPSVVGACTLPAAVEFPDADALFAALRSGRVDVAWTSTAAPNVPDDVVVLADRTSLIRAENVVPLYRRNEMMERQVLALNEVAGELDTGALADMLRQLDEGADPGALAASWIDSHPLGN